MHAHTEYISGFLSPSPGPQGEDGLNARQVPHLPTLYIKAPMGKLKHFPFPYPLHLSFDSEPTKPTGQTDGQSFVVVQPDLLTGAWRNGAYSSTTLLNEENPGKRIGYFTHRYPGPAQV